MNPLLPPHVQEHLVLASRSPRRQDILCGLEFDIDIHPAPDDVEKNVTTTDLDMRPLEGATLKARWVAERFPDATVIAADTVVLIDGEILEKPVDDHQAKLFLRKLSGATHRVITGVVVRRHAEDREVGERETTSVTFRELSDEEIDGYVGSGEGRDKAGAYAVQGLGAGLVSRIDGCFYNVVGLPVSLLFDLLKRMQ